jgi:hypothetical protein
MHLFKKLFSAFGLVLVLSVFFLPHLALAQTTSKEIPLQVEIPGISSPCKDKANAGRMCVTDIGDYISKFYIYFAGAAGILATCMILFAGFTWITAAGNASRIEKAKGMMNGAFIGLVLTLTSYLILKTINPELVKLRMPPLGVIEKEVLATNFCKDMPKESGLPVVSEAETIPCGQTRGLNEATAGKAGYSQGYCCGSFCPKEQDAASQKICASMTGVATSEGDECPETCIFASSLCANYDKNNCEAFNLVLLSQGVTNVVCRKHNIPGFDRCTLSKITACETNYTRISCAYFGIAHDVDTPCWSVHNPKSADRKYCTDIMYPGEDTDAICCAGQNKNQIACRKTCNDQEVQVSCSAYNNSSVDYKESDDGSAFCTDKSANILGEYKCCMKLIWTSGTGESDITPPL